MFKNKVNTAFKSENVCSFPTYKLLYSLPQSFTFLQITMDSKIDDSGFLTVISQDSLKFTLSKNAASASGLLNILVIGNPSKELFQMPTIHSSMLSQVVFFLKNHEQEPFSNIVCQDMLRLFLILIFFFFFDIK